MASPPDFYAIFTSPDPPEITAGLLAVKPPYPYRLADFVEPTWPGYARATSKVELQGSTPAPRIAMVQGKFFFPCDSVDPPLAPWGLWLECTVEGVRRLMAVNPIGLDSGVSFGPGGRTWSLSIALVGADGG